MADVTEKQANAYFNYAYETSAVFATMKKVEERIQKNYSTEQYLNALDTMIAHMVEHVIRSTDFMDHMVAGILAWHSDTANHKITAHDKLDAVQYLMAFLTRQTPDEKLIVFKRIRFDRNITLLIVDSWLTQLKTYRASCEAQIQFPNQISTTLEHHKNVIHLPHHSSLYAAVPAVTYWRDHVLMLREQIVEKYYRLILNEAKSFYELMDHSISFDDTIQSMFLEASKAIDKCNQERGTITSYMQRWIRFSRSKLGTEMDTAFVTKGTARNGDYSYKSTSLDQVEDSLLASTDIMDTQNTVMHVRKLARLLDPLGIGRHSLGIEEYVPALTAYAKRKPI